MATQISTASASASTSATPISNSFFNAKAQSSRRSIPSSYDMSPQSQYSHSRRGSSTLAVVPENHGHGTSLDHPVRGPPPAPPSAFKSKEISNNQGHGQKSRQSSRRTVSDTSASTGDLREMEKALEMKMRRSSSDKGKLKELPSNSQNVSGGQQQQQQQQSKRKRADWVIDLVETHKGVDTWVQDQRVILALGEPTPASLAPILYDPAFSDTLLLVGSYQPLPAIEALLSPSHLMSASPNQEIYPTVQPFTLSIESNDTDAHALTVLLAQATTLAQQYRSKPKFNSRSNTPSRPRAESYASSSASNSPPSTPPMRKRVLSNFGISASSSARSSMESNTSTTDRQRSASMYDTSNDSTPKAKNRITSFGRDSIFGGMRRNSDASDNLTSKIGNSTSTSYNGSLFDAVVNFVPEMKNFKAERALQDMLHQAVVVTTGVMPSITRQGSGKSSSTSSSTSKSAIENQLPISLIHVLPKLMPAPLPNVIESFLLSLLPTFQLRSSREIFGNVVTSPVWLSPFVESRPLNQNQEENPEDVSGAQVLLFGGVRCPYQVLDDTQDQFRPRAFLSNWSSCIEMPGLISESRKPSSTTGSSNQRRNIQHERQLSSPPSIPYSSVQNRTPPQSRSPSPPKGVRTHQPKSNLPRSASMPISSSLSSSSPSPNSSSGNGISNSGGTTTTRRSKLHVSHTPPSMSETELPLTSPTTTEENNTTSRKENLPTPDLDLDSSINSSSCASSLALGDHNGIIRRESDNSGMSGDVIVKNSTNNEGGITLENQIGDLKNGKKGFKSWFKKNKNFVSK